VAAGIAANEAVEVTLTLNGDSIDVSAKGTSDTMTVANRLYKADSGIGILFNQYDTTRRTHKVEVL
jgi:hypothetical protein